MLQSIDPHLDLVAVAGERCIACVCGQHLGPVAANWKHHATCAVIPPHAAGPHIRLHAELELREFACPACGTLLSVELARHGEPFRRDLQLLDASSAAAVSRSASAAV